jgi:hypothetical protein
LQSRIACLHYEFYSSLEEVTKEIQARESEVQCTVAKSGALPIPAFSFGKAQEPALWDYPDGADTLAFLASL